jgi:hypothetical protein
MQRVLLAFTPIALCGSPFRHPAASACCGCSSGVTKLSTTPMIPIAATMAVIAKVVCVIIIQAGDLIWCRI